jgi:hypothetical protein
MLVTVRSRRLPGALLILGFVGIVFWTVTSLIPAPFANEQWVYEIATTSGYGLAGIATWRWIVGNSNAPGGSTFSAGPSRWMAAASVVTAAGVAAMTYYIHRVGGTQYYHLHLAGAAAGALGFLLAAAGFWIASSARPASQSQNGRISPNSPETENSGRIAESV